MLQLARKDPPVELVELHQLDEVCELRMAIIQSMEQLTIIFYGYNLIVFYLLSMTH